MSNLPSFQSNYLTQHFFNYSDDNDTFYYFSNNQQCCCYLCSNHHSNHQKHSYIYRCHIHQNILLHHKKYLNHNFKYKMNIKHEELIKFVDETCKQLQMTWLETKLLLCCSAALLLCCSAALLIKIT